MLEYEFYVDYVAEYTHTYLRKEYELARLSGCSTEQTAQLQSQARACEERGFEYNVQFLNLSSVFDFREPHFHRDSLDAQVVSIAKSKLPAEDIAAGVATVGICLPVLTAWRGMPAHLKQSAARRYFLIHFLGLPAGADIFLPTWRPHASRVQRFAPWGAWPSAFRPLSEKAVKIYVYPMPSQFHTGRLGSLPEEAVRDWKEHSVLNSDYALCRCFEAYEGRVQDPDDATFFFLPVYGSLFVPWGPSGNTAMLERERLLHEYLAAYSSMGHVAQRKERAKRLAVNLTAGEAAPPALWEDVLEALFERLESSVLESLTGISGEYLLRHSGRDHIIPVHSGMPSSSWKTLRYPAIRLITASFRGTGRDADELEYVVRWRGYGKKDILVPWRLLRPSRRAEHVQQGQEGFAFYAASFQVGWRLSRYRRLAADLLAADPSSVFQEIGRERTLKGTPGISQMARFRFCLEIPGDQFQTTSRPFDAVLHGCIPVLLYPPRIVLPFEDDLDWSSFSIRYNINVLDDGRNLMERLQAIPEDRVRLLAERGRHVRRYFAIDEDCNNRPNAFDLILSNLARQLDSG